MSRTPRQPSPRTAKPRVDSTSTSAECKCHFRNSEFRGVTTCRLTKVTSSCRNELGCFDGEFAEAAGERNSRFDRDRTGYLETFSGRARNGSEEFTSVTKFKRGQRCAPRAQLAGLQAFSTAPEGNRWA